jgi:hypothetical protein
MPDRSLAPFSPADRRHVLEACITRHGLTPSLPAFPEGDHRVSLCLIWDGTEVAFVAALPPSAIELLEQVCDRAYPRRLIASDYTFGNIDGSPTRDRDLEEKISLLGRGGRMDGRLAGDLAHARDLARKASIVGHRWTGAEEDYPPCLRPGAAPVRFAPPVLFARFEPEAAV